MRTSASTGTARTPRTRSVERRHPYPPSGHTGADLRDHGESVAEVIWPRCTPRWTSRSPRARPAVAPVHPQCAPRRVAGWRHGARHRQASRAAHRGCRSGRPHGNATSSYLHGLSDHHYLNSTDLQQQVLERARELQAVVRGGGGELRSAAQRLAKLEREATYGRDRTSPDLQVAATLVLAQVQLELAREIDRLTGAQTGHAPAMTPPIRRCPRCGRKLRLHRDGTQWRACHYSLRVTAPTTARTPRPGGTHDHDGEAPGGAGAAHGHRRQRAVDRRERSGRDEGGGRTKAERDASTTEAMAGDYDHLLQTAMQWRTP